MINCDRYNKVRDSNNLYFLFIKLKKKTLYIFIPIY